MPADDLLCLFISHFRLYLAIFSLSCRLCCTYYICGEELENLQSPMLGVLIFLEPRSQEKFFYWRSKYALKHHCKQLCCGTRLTGRCLEIFPASLAKVMQRRGLMMQLRSTMIEHGILWPNFHATIMHEKIENESLKRSTGPRWRSVGLEEPDSTVGFWIPLLYGIRKWKKKQENRWCEVHEKVSAILIYKLSSWLDITHSYGLKAVCCRKRDYSKLIRCHPRTSETA